MNATTADIVLTNGRITTLGPKNPQATAVAMADGRILAVGDEADLAPHTGPDTRRLDLGGRTVIPGLNDSHIHVIRGGLNYNMELRWDGVPSLADALRLLKEQARRTPPVGLMRERGIPVGAGTDATRVASYNPWVSLYWLTSGKTVGGLSLYGDDNRLDRTTALELYTRGSAWFSGDEEKKGLLAPGRLADLAVLSADYFSVPDEAIKGIESVRTIMDGKIVHGSGKFASLAPALPPASPNWSPTGKYPAMTPWKHGEQTGTSLCRDRTCGEPLHRHTHTVIGPRGNWGLGCTCFAF